MQKQSTCSKMKGYAVAAMMLCGLFSGINTALAAEFPVLTAYGTDTIAGYSTLMSTSRTFPDRDVVFTVTKPDGAKVNIPSVTDFQGVAKSNLYDYHTRKAGTYKISARFQDEVNDGPPTSFKVYPDQVSLEQSSVAAGKTLAKADGSDAVFLTVDIRDQYGNPFPGHLINLISSRSNDWVKAGGASPITDENGSVTFSVTSSQAGVSVFSAVDTTAGVVLSARSQVAFLKNGSSLDDAGGNLSMWIPVASAADAGPLNHFTISDIPDTVQSRQNISFRVTAKDADEMTVENYTGTVHFSVQGSEGDNVTLPEDYTFKAEDLGTHLFSLGLSFTLDGTYKLQVTDTAETLIKGEKTVIVASGSGSTAVTTTGDKPSVSIPAAGSYSSATQTISGAAPAGSTVNIFDNEQQIGTVQANSSGNFQFQTSPLADGKHEIYVVNLDEEGQVQGTSESVEITIDTTPPTVDDIQLNPTAGIKPGTVIEISVLSEENLADSALIFNSEIVALAPSAGQPGTYSAQLTAPADPGAYPVDVVLVDQLNNEATYSAKATVNVAEEGGSVETQETQLTEETATQETQAVIPENMPPTQVFGLIAYGSDKRVTLVWEAANDDVNVNHYRVYYGLNPASMDRTVDTKSAATTWYVPGLENGKEYYFAVTAVDDPGLESAIASEVVSGIPFALELTTTITDLPEGPLSLTDGHGAAIEGYIPPEVTRNGPEAVWLLAGTGILSGIVRKIRRALKTRK